MKTCILKPSFLFIVLILFSTRALAENAPYKVLEDDLTKEQASKWLERYAANHKARSGRELKAYDGVIQGYEHGAEPTRNQVGIFTSLSAGYLFNQEEPYYIFQLGYEFQSGLAFFIQYGHSEANAIDLNLGDKDSYTFQSLSLGLSYDWDMSEKFSITFGGSLGMTRNEIDVVDLNDGSGVSVDKDSLYADLFARANYRIIRNLDIFIGLRLLYIDDNDVLKQAESIDAADYPDIGSEIGLTYHF